MGKAPKFEIEKEFTTNANHSQINRALGGDP
jgi:hypothetical protein